MIYQIESASDLLAIAQKVSSQGVPGLLFVEQSSTVSGGAIGFGNQTYGFEPQQTFHILLQTSIGTYYFEADYQEQEVINNLLEVISDIKALYPQIPVEKVDIDRKKILGSIVMK